MGAFPPLYVDTQLHDDHMTEAILLRDNDRTPVQADYDEGIVLQRVVLRPRLPAMHRERAKSF